MTAPQLPRQRLRSIPSRSKSAKVVLGREPISFERPGDVRFGAHSGLKLDIAALPKSANNGD